MLGGQPQAIPDFTCGKWMIRECKDVVKLKNEIMKFEKSRHKFYKAICRQQGNNNIYKIILRYGNF